MTPTEPTQPPVSPTPNERGSAADGAAADTPVAHPVTDARQATGASAVPQNPAATPAAKTDTAEQRPAETATTEKTAKAEKPTKPKKQLTPEQQATQRRRRGALASGALSMPIIALGVTLMAVPLGIWYVSTVFKTVIVVITNMVTGEREAKSVNGALNNVDPGAMSSISVALIIVGAVLSIAALLVSYFMLRATKVEKPMLVTIFSVPLASVVSAVVIASIGALGGLIFRDTTHTVSGILGNAALGIAGFALAAIAVSIVIGGAVWWWVAHIFRNVSAEGSQKKH
ncbi:hypothetical protein [Agrococcus casei]|uniref:hypothetical protein n=1 Tax=Agrococcus casei TaxID=343512 RepID=UPI003F9126E9